jgi:hypothetical protein
MYIKKSDYLVLIDRSNYSEQYKWMRVCSVFNAKLDFVHIFQNESIYKCIFIIKKKPRFIC